MPLISLKQLLDHAAENQYGLPAFNINNMEQGLSIMDAANESDANEHTTSNDGNAARSA